MGKLQSEEQIFGAFKNQIVSYCDLIAQRTSVAADEKSHVT